MSTLPNDDLLSNSIAVIGMACRFPRATNPKEYWKLLHDGIECVEEITEADLIKAGLNPEVLHHPNFVSRQVVLDDIDIFDADFFGYFPRDAEILDPQQRILLECAWEALESSAYIPEKSEEVIGVFAGSDMSQYLFNVYSNREIMESVGLFQVNLANDKDHVTTRVAYKLNLNGPAVTVQTTCSTSLVAISMACQSLLSYQCDIALAGGTAIALTQKVGYVYQEGGIASPDGYCRAFDARGQGTIGGSGAGMVVLKRLEEALADGDEIQAIVRGFALNNDGALKVGYTAPSVEGQSEVIAMAQAMAEVDPGDITYVEAHGTATPLGDPIEVRALTEAFRGGTTKTNYCGIGSVKTNLGHMNSAAGVGGFMKVVLALKNKQLPPSLHFETPNPNIDFHHSPFYVVDRLRDWEPGDRPRIAGISSFGIGGTNAHVILEEAPKRQARDGQQDWLLFPFSARTESALEQLVERHRQFWEESPDLDLADVAYTLQVGRRDFRYRTFRLLESTTAAEAAEKLRRSPGGIVQRVEEEGAERPVVFMFSGQGSQYVNMARALYTSQPLFRAEMDRCNELVRAYSGLDILALIYPAEGAEAAAQEALRQTANTQVALFVVEYALAQVWLAWGIRPSAMVGHSIGEYVAACVAGVFSLEDSLKIVVERGRLMQSVEPGGMLSIPLAEREVLSSLPAGISVSVLNSPQQTVVSGSLADIAALEEGLLARGLKCQRLQTSHAFHSQMFDPIVGPFADIIGQYEAHPPRIPFVSNTSGTWIQEEEAMNPNYWARHLRQPVRFFENIETLNEQTGSLFLEIGPGTTLQRLTQSILEAADQHVLASTPHPKDRSSASRTMVQTLGSLWLHGLPVDWSGYYGEEKRGRLSLPTYPFERKRFWISPPQVTEAAGPARKKDMSEWFYVPKWEVVQPYARVATPETLHLPQERFVVFLDKQGYGQPFVDYLSERPGVDLIVVRAGRSFAQPQPNTFKVNPRKKGDYEKLLTQLQTERRLPEVLLHFWNIDHRVVPSAKKAKGIKYAGFYSLLFFSQAYAKLQPEAQCAIRVFTRELYALKDSDQPASAQALAVGAGRVIQQELPNFTFQNIDLNGASLEPGIIGNILGGREGSPAEAQEVTAWRDDQQWKLGYERTKVEAINQLKLRFRPGGVYLLTGGLGGIGSIIAKFLAYKYRAKLILLNRTPLPPRSEWAAYLAQQEGQRGDRSSRKINLIQDMEAFGAEVLTAAIDITDERALQKLKAKVAENFGRLHGIVHSAGVAGGGILSLKTEEEAQRVFAPKVDGTLTLHEVFGGEELDFFILCSSLSAILGGMGQIDYCAANSFQDAFAHQLAQGSKSTYYLSINWDTWGEVGMAVETEVPDNMKQWQAEGLKRGIRNVEGMQLFELLLSSTLPQIATSTTNLHQRFVHHPDAAEPEAPIAPAPTPTKTESSTARHQRPDLSTDYLAPRDSKEEKMAYIWQELLGIAPIGVRDNFLELGGHSLLAIQLISRMRDTFGREISIQDFFEEPTVERVAQRLGGVDETGELKADEDQSIGDAQNIRRVSRSDYRVDLDDEDF
ncbi:MAG: SDR family NAD(P)-dependent oxidoreductase [Bacteroidota bacterium]